MKLTTLSSQPVESEDDAKLLIVKVESATDSADDQVPADSYNDSSGDASASKYADNSGPAGCCNVTEVSGSNILTFINDNYVNTPLHHTRCLGVITINHTAEPFALSSVSHDLATFQNSQPLSSSHYTWLVSHLNPSQEQSKLRRAFPHK